MAALPRPEVMDWLAGRGGLPNEYNDAARYDYLAASVHVFLRGEETKRQLAADLARVEWWSVAERVSDAVREACRAEWKARAS
jgi:hypothetical protein